MGDPATTALLAGTIGSSLIGGITAPQGQQLTSFEGIPGADPAQMFGETKGLLSNYLNALLKDAGQPVKLNTTVAPLPIFKGGALPTSISAGAVDPNRYSPSLRSTPGVEIPPAELSAVDPSVPRRRTFNGDNNPNNGDGRTAYDPRPKKLPVTPGSNPGRTAADPRGGTADEQASAAAELLASLGGGDDRFAIPDVGDPGSLPKRRLGAA